MSEEITEKWRQSILIQQRQIFPKKEVFRKFNKVLIGGKIEREFEEAYTVGNEKVFKTRIIAKRISGKDDFVPIEVRESLIRDYLDTSVIGKNAEIGGFFKSYKKPDEKHKHLSVFVNAINIYDEKKTINLNRIFLDAYICTKPCFFITSSGVRKTEILIAVRRNYNSDYLNCIAFDNNALYLRDLQVGDRVRLLGRVRSKEYFKRLSPDSDEGEYKVAYIVLIEKVEKV